ncbi:TPA: helix-turn-helix domain-containing protein [Streptococcus suis]
MNRLKELRQEKKLSQKELADYLGINEKTISRWEKGDSTIKSDKAQALADHFGVSVGYLLGFTEDKEYGLTEEDDDNLTETGREYARLYLHDKTLDQFENLIRKQSSTSEIIKKDESDFFVQVDPEYIIHERITGIYNLLALSPREYQEIILAWSCLSYDEQRKVLDMLNLLISEKLD